MYFYVFFVSFMVYFYIFKFLFLCFIYFYVFSTSEHYLFRSPQYIVIILQKYIERYYLLNKIPFNSFVNKIIWLDTKTDNNWLMSN